MSPLVRLRATIVDSGMRNHGGHNFSYTRSVESALREKGFDVTVLANKSLAPEIIRQHGYKPTFSLGRYDYPPGLGRWRDLLHLYAQSIVYADELEAALARQPAGDLVLCHTTNDMELLGWSWLVGRHDPGGTLVWIEHLTPRYAGQRKLKLWLHPYWRIKPRHLNRLRRRLGLRFVLCTDSEALTEDYGTVYPHRILTLPLPLDPRLTAEAAARDEWIKEQPAAEGRLLSIGYLGDSSPVKGFPLVPDLVRGLLADPSFRARFVIQCVLPPAVSEDRQIGGSRELSMLAVQSPGRLSLVTHRLSPEEYAALMARLDIVLIPYDHENFREGTSQVFAEALAAAKPVVVPRGTWMSRELQKGGGGLAFERGNARDLAEKTAKLVEGYNTHAMRAQEFAPVWREFHHPRKLVDMVLREAGLGPLAAEAQCGLA